MHFHCITMIFACLMSVNYVTPLAVKSCSVWKQNGIIVAGGNGAGSQKNQLNGPSGIFIDKTTNNLYIADTKNYRIQLYKQGATDGITIAGGHREGDASFRLYWPTDVFLDQNNNIYVADCHRVQKFASHVFKGSTVIATTYDTINTSKNESGCFRIFIDNHEKLYTVDGQTHRILKYEPNETERIILSAVTKPNGIYIEANGNIFVSDANNHRIQKFQRGTPNVLIVAGNGTCGNDANHLCQPSYLLGDDETNIYIADTGNHRIQRYSKGKSVGETVVGGNGRGSSDDKMSRPAGLAFDNDGNLFVADHDNHRVIKYLHDNSKCDAAVYSSVKSQSVSDNIVFPDIKKFESTGTASFCIVPKKLDECNLLVKRQIETIKRMGKTNKQQSKTMKHQIELKKRAEEKHRQQEETVKQLRLTIQQLNDKIMELETPNNGIKWTTARWQQNGVTVAGGNESGKAENQLSKPISMDVLNDETLLVADWANHRIVEWKKGAETGQVVVHGDNEDLMYPSAVIADNETDSLIICASGNQQVQKWSRRNVTKKFEVLIDDINCSAMTMDDQRNLYITDSKKHEVKRFRIGEKTGTVVAGGNGEGSGLNQLSCPTFAFVDREHSVYVADYYNSRVMKWLKGANEGIVVAGGQGEGTKLTQLYYPWGLFVDDFGTVFVTELGDNQRVTRWLNGTKEGSIVLGGNKRGEGANQFDDPVHLSVDRKGNFYVVDFNNHRIQKFSIVMN